VISPLFQQLHDGLNVKLYPVGPLQSNCTLIYDETTKEAILVDPGDDLNFILELINHYQLKVITLLHTHAHFDHIGCTKRLKEQSGSKIVMHQEEIQLYSEIEQQGAMFGMNVEGPGVVDDTITHNSTIKLVAREIMKTLHTPGHTRGGCSFYLDSFDPPLVITGDTLFRLSIGRTDLPGGDYRTIINSIKEHLFCLPDETVVLPGHGPTTTIKDEKSHNPFVKQQ
jgi:hydroxyacylglutathione hydrolase